MANLIVPDEQTFATFTVVSSTSSFPISFAIFEKADLTVLVDGVARAGGIEPFTIFEVTPLGIVVVAWGMLYLAVVGRWLLPERASMANL